MVKQDQAKQGDQAQLQQVVAPIVEGLENLPQVGQAGAALQRVTAAPPGEIKPDDIRILQRTIGNRAVRDILAGRSGDVDRLAGETGATIQRAVLGQVMRDDGDAGGAEAVEEAVEEAAVDPGQEALQDFLEQGMMPSEEGQDVIGAGGLGGFNAKFDPDQRKLIVTVNVGINFHHSLSIDPASGAVFPDLSGMNSDDPAEMARILTWPAIIMNGIPNIPDRVRKVNQDFRWDPAEKGPWMTRYRNAVLAVWHNRHFFQSTRWEELQSNVEVVLNTEEIGPVEVISEAIRGAVGASSGYHCTARIIKSPPSGLGAYVTGGEADEARDQGLFMSSSGIDPNRTNFLRYSLQFEDGQADLATARGTVHGNDAGPAYLRKFIADFQEGRAGQGIPIEITGRASATGNPAANRRLSRRRADAVAAFLQAEGLQGAVRRVTAVGTGAEGATEADEWRRVDIVVGSGEAQNTAAHEFGHMIGLGDEYAAPAGGFAPADPANPGSDIAIGANADHDAMAQAMGGGVQGAVGENTDSIMSVGNTVRPQHYATFHHALQEVTGESWEYGGAVARGGP
jgi:hypothetical protein